MNYEIVPYENTREKEVLNFTSGGDLTMALVDLVWISEFAENGWIEPIDKFKSDASITDPNLKLEGFFPLLLDAFGEPTDRAPSATKATPALRWPAPACRYRPRYHPQAQALPVRRPLSNLDAELRTQMRVEIARLHKALGATMVYVYP